MARRQTRANPITLHSRFNPGMLAGLPWEVVMRSSAVAVMPLCVGASAAQAQYLGNLTANPTLPRAAPLPPGTLNDPYGNSATSPHLYDSHGGFHGDLNANRYDPNSVANPYGRYGSRYSPDSINNPYGKYGSRYAPESATNPYGHRMPVYRPGNGDDQ
jgi:hypothetical protein